MGDKTNPTPAADEAAGDPVSFGDLVQLGDGRYAIVTEVEPVHVLILGAPERHELPLTRIR